MNFKNTVIVVSHDRHFLDNVCTYIADPHGVARFLLFSKNRARNDLSRVELPKFQPSSPCLDRRTIFYIYIFSFFSSVHRTVVSRVNVLHGCDTVCCRASKVVGYTPQFCVRNVLNRDDASVIAGSDPIFVRASRTVGF